MSNLIAIVATAVVVNGERIVVQPGEPLPDLGEHDTVALTKSGAAFDKALQDRQQKKDADVESAALDEFQEARERVQAEAASIAKLPDAAGQEPVKPAGKTAAKKS